MPDDVYLEDSLNQIAVYWAPGSGGDEGQATFAEPIEIRCRWEQVTEQFLEKRTGNPETSRSKVYADQDLEELGVLWLPPDQEDTSDGAGLSQLTDESQPFANAGAFEIRRFDKIPNWDADEFARIAYL